MKNIAHGVAARISRRLTGAPTRVALAATGVVALVYLAISCALVGVVSHNLTESTDGRLATALSHLQRGQLVPQGTGGFSPYQDPEDRHFGTPTLEWVIVDGALYAPPGQDAVLPVDDQHVVGPQTVSISGAGVQVLGGPATFLSGQGWAVVGQATSGVGQAESTVLIAESLVAPPLLVLVFLGALTIGRRAADPIERARQRQLEFTADASHELRTPLAIIEAETSLALALPRSADGYRTTLGKIDGESKRLRRLVDDLLWLSRVDAMPDPPKAEAVDLAVVARGAVERFLVVADRRSQRIVTDLHDGRSGSVIVTAPTEWLDRLLGVLLDNACRYSGEGGVVSVSVTSNGSRVRLTVEDDGPGIPPDERETIFDRFHRASATAGGAGLGLAIGDAVVRGTGGRWVIGESPAGGASMSVLWPHGADH